MTVYVVRHRQARAGIARRSLRVRGRVDDFPEAQHMLSLVPAQNTVVEEVQQLPWRLCYARDKAQPAPTAAASAGADALQVR